MYTELVDIYEDIEYFNKSAFMEALSLFKFFKNRRLPDGKKAGIKRAKSIIDMGCGTAVHFPYLSPFFRLVGVDISEKMIRRALEQGRKVRRTAFVVADIREVKFFKRFDGAYSIFGTLAHLVESHDLDIFLSNLARNLKRKAGFVFDVWNALPFMLSPSSERCFSVKTGGYLIERKVSYRVLPGSLLKVQENIEVFRGSEKREYEYSYLVRFFLRKSVEDILEKYGFKVLGVYSDYDGSPYDDNAQKMVFFTYLSRRI